MDDTSQACLKNRSNLKLTFLIDLILLFSDLCRESIYQLLSQTTPENTCKNYAGYSINPKTRYQSVNASSIQPNQVSALIYPAET